MGQGCSFGITRLEVGNVFLCYRKAIADHLGVDLQNTITFHHSFTATAILHPATYLNKVLVGSKQGELQLWNTRTWYAIPLLPF